MVMTRRAPHCGTSLITLGLGVATIVIALFANPAVAQAPSDTLPVAAVALAPASGLLGTDVENDAGRSLALTWKASPDDSIGKVAGYYVDRAEDPTGPWRRVDSLAAGVTAYTDQSVKRNTDYFYRISTYSLSQVVPAGSVTGPLRATSQWFNNGRYSVLVGTILFFGFVLYFSRISA